MASGPDRSSLAQYYQGSAYKEIPPGKAAILSYFKSFKNAPRNLTPPNLRQYLREMDNYIFDSEELVTILRQTADLFGGTHATNSMRLHFFDQRISPWLQQSYHLKDLDPEFLCGTINSFANLGIQPGGRFLGRWHIHACENLSGFGTDQLSDSLRGFAKLGIVPRLDFLKLWVASAVLRIEKFSTKHLSTALHSMAIFHTISPDIQYKDVAAFLLHELKKRESKEKYISRINSANIIFDFPLWQADSEKHKDSPSIWEKGLRAAFQEVGCVESGEEDNFIAAINATLDFRFVFDTHEAIVQADGPFHFVKNIDDGTLHFNGTTLLQTSGLKKIFPNDVIARLRYMDSKEFRVQNNIFDLNMEEMASCLMKHLQTAKPGAYQTCIKDTNIGLEHIFESDIIPLARPKLSEKKKNLYGSTFLQSKYADLHI